MSDGCNALPIQMSLFSQGHARPSNLDLFHAWERLGSVRKVGELFGIAPQTVHKRIKRTSLYKPHPPEFTPAQLERIKEYYLTTVALAFNLNELAKELGKSRQNVCRAARRLGLSNPRRPANAETRAKSRLHSWKNKPHPRGMKGKKHTESVKAAIGLKSKRTWATWKTFNIGLMAPEARDALSERSRQAMAKRPASSNYSRTKGGYREDLGGIYFRSSWEANYARYLNLLIKLGVVESWEFEPETFWFEGIRRGVTNYRPDFRVKYKGDDKPEYIEIKGWIVPKDKTKWARMKKYHPDIKLTIVKAKQYYNIQKKWASCIPNWETAKDSKLVVRAA